ncbi:MAG TPA: MarR family transcriptional regulator [Nitrososphaeraceae archaeon]|jgi:MarR family transcriptional regulator for hemolysin
MQPYDYRNSIGFIVNRTAKVFVKALDSELREKVGITFGQWKVLVMLSIQDGITQKEIANKLELEAATLIPIIDKMEKEGFVVRQADKSDRRNNRIYRTDKAESLWDQMVECATKIREISVNDISEKHITIMRNSLEKICENLKIQFNIGCDIAGASTSVDISIPSSNKNVKKKVKSMEGATY